MFNKKLRLSPLYSADTAMDSHRRRAGIGPAPICCKTAKPGEEFIPGFALYA
jgi:hypothetical protein